MIHMKIQSPRMIRLLTVLSIAAVAISSYAQDSDTILKAMKDELHRNMDSLVNEEGQKPFFIGYGINDVQTRNVNATLGAIMNSSDNQYKEKYVRVLAGGYEFNDESLDISNENPQTLNDIDMPVDDDYYGIRRALWSSTDAVFKSASKIVRENMQYVESQNKPLDQIPHKQFAKVPVITKLIPNSFVWPDKSQVENLVRDLSAEFLKYDQFDLSDVNFIGYRSTYYFANSEGITIQVPYNSIQLMIEMQTISDNGQVVSDNFSYYGDRMEDLPSRDEIIAMIHTRAQNLIKNRQSSLFQDSYDGPVLFLDEASPDVDFLLLFGSPALVADHQIETNADPTYGGFSLRTSSNIRIGKKIISDKLSVTSLPTLTEFNGKKALGSFPVDAEGVVPQDQLVLIKDGVLVSQLNDRTIADSTQSPNGNYRTLSGVRPSVISVSSRETLSNAALKEKLIEEAKSEGLDFAIVIRESLLSQSFGSPLSIYKVDLKTGEETLLRNASIPNLTLRSLNKVIATSDKQILTNIRIGREMVSIIAPNAILIEDINVEPTPAYFTQKPPLVPNPLTGN